MPSIYECDPETIRALDDAGLLAIDSRIHKVAREDLMGVANDHRLGKLLSRLADVHRMALEEMGQRGIAHPDREPDCLAGLESREKIRTDFGEFVREVPVANLPAIVVSGEEGEGIRAGDYSFLAFPPSPASSRILAGSTTIPALLVAGKNAIGRILLLLPGRIADRGQLPPHTLDLGEGSEESLKIVGFTFLAFLSPVGVRTEGTGPVRAEGSIIPDSAPLEKAGEPETKDVTPALVAGLPEEALRRLANLLRLRSEPFFDRGAEPEELANAMAFVLAEIDRRGIDLESRHRLDALARFVAPIGKDAGREVDPVPASLHRDRVAELHRGLPDSIVICPGFVSVSGSYVYAKGDRPPNDLDLIYRHPPGASIPGGSGTYLKLERACRELTSLPVQHISEPSGPNWSHAELYDLVLIKRPAAEIRVIREDFARFIKAAIEPGEPFEPSKAGGEFYAGQPFRDLLERWGDAALAIGPVIVQPKIDGFSMAIHVANGKVSIFTESGRDRAFLFPGVTEWVRGFGKDLIMIGEFVPLVLGKFVPRQEGIWMITANSRPAGNSARIVLHDLLWLGGRDLSGEPYPKRFAALERVAPEGRIEANADSIELVPSAEAENAEELLAALHEAGSMFTSEGAILKRADWIYRPGASQVEWAKWKNVVEYDAVVIGARRVPAGKPEGVRWSRKEALADLRARARESRTWVLRVAVKDRAGRLIPIEADRTLTPKDLALDWDEGKQRYQGTDDPKLWTPPLGFACPGFRHRGRGQQAYGNTFAVRIDEPPKCGLIVSIAPGQFQRFRRADGGFGYAHTFPRVTAIKPEGGEPGRIDGILEAFGRIRPGALAKELCGI